MPIIYPKKTEMPSADPAERRTNWDEVALGYTLERAVVEAHRCLQCQDPLCEQGCPVNVPIRDFIRRVAHGDLEGAAAHDQAQEPPARDLRPRLPGGAPVRAALRRPRQAGAGGDRPARAVRGGLGARARVGRAPAAGRRRPEKVAIIGSGPAGPHRGQRPRPARLLGHRLRGAARDRRRPALRHPRVPPPEGDRRRGRRAPAGAWASSSSANMIVGKTVTIDQLFDGAGLRGRVHRHRRRLAEVHEHPGGEPQGRLLGERVPHPRQPDARLLLPELRHAGAASAAGGRRRRRRHRHGRRARVDQARRRGGAHRLPALRGRDGGAGRGLPPCRRGRGDLRLADPADALPRRRGGLGERHGVPADGARRAGRVGPPPARPRRGLRVHAWT